MFKLHVPKSWDPVKLHDYWNLCVIALINVLNFWYIATGTGFAYLWVTSITYFLFDTVYVGVYPQSVKSPVAILSHHIITALYMLIPAAYPQYHWCMAACMTVELNTWLLIARRVVGGAFIELSFYATWVALRNVLYPYLIYAFYLEWRNETALCGSPWNPILVTPVCQAVLSALNYHWTLQLVFKVLARRPRGGADGGGPKAGGSGGKAGGGKAARGGAGKAGKGGGSSMMGALAAVADVRAERDTRPKHA